MQTINNKNRKDKKNKEIQIRLAVSAPALSHKDAISSYT